MPSFTPPTRQESMSGFALWSRYGSKVGRSVLKRAGIFTTVDMPWLGELIDMAEGVDFFLGGRTYPVSDALAADLTADGFTVDYDETYGAGPYGSGLYGDGPYGV